MIGIVTTYFEGKIQILGLFEKIFPFVEQKILDSKTVLAQYKSKGEYEYITDFDNYRGVAYFRQYEDVDIKPIESTTRACIDLLEVGSKRQLDSSNCIDI